jgi:hypothetical protein
MYEPMTESGKSHIFIGMSNVWMGLSDILKETKFLQLSDAHKIKFANWAKGQPDNYKNNEDCIEWMGSGKWNDINCDDKNAFVCELA